MFDMNQAHVARIDLNLLVAFTAMFDELQVTRAAARTGVTQSAMSHALARLRAHLDDELFIRTPRGLLPTPKAQALAPTVKRLLDELDRALAPTAPFDPATLERTFTIATTDYAEIVLLPPLLEIVRRVAPKVSLRLRPASLRLDQDLEASDLDLAFAPAVELSPRLIAPKLFDDHFVCVVRSGHPGVGRRLTLKRFVGLDHLQISPRGGPGGPVDDALARMRMRRRVALFVPNFLSAPMIVAESDLVLTLAARVAALLAPRFDLSVFPTPLDVPGFSIHQIWHEQRKADAGHAWLRGLVADVAKGVSSGLSRLPGLTALSTYAFCRFVQGQGHRRRRWQWVGRVQA